MPDKHRPTVESRARVMLLATGLGGNKITMESIAIDLGISEPTLRKYYAAELERGKTELYAQAVEAAHMLISELNPQVVLAVMKGVGGIQEQHTIEHKGQPYEIVVNVGEKSKEKD